MYSIPMRFDLPSLKQSSFSPNILCFNWNSNKLPLCGAYVFDDNHNPLEKKSDNCYNPLFFQSIYENILMHDPMICVFVTEGDPENKTYFHSTFLPENMHYYKLIANDKFSNDESTLRMSIYIKYDDTITKVIELNDGWLFSDNHYQCELKYDPRSTKALALYLDTIYGIFAFVGIQVPDKSSNGEVCVEMADRKFVRNKDVDYVFLMGDFSNDYLLSQKEYNNFALVDKIHTDSIPPTYCEGSISPQLYPNYNIRRPELDRMSPQLYPKVTGSYKEANDGRYNISWHDRIFYKTINKDNDNIISCISYQTVNNYPMLSSPQSQHMGILGVFEMIPNTVSDDEKLVFTKSYAGFNFGRRG